VRIVYLNPWKDAAEHQIYFSQKIAAERLGHELIHCANSSEIENASPDFVLAVSSTQPKLTDFPTYGVISWPRHPYLTHRCYYHNLLSYDGYLTISDSIGKFLRNFSYAHKKEPCLGLYYVSCHRQDSLADIRRLAEKRALKITYFGTNWDKRRDTFFRALSTRNDVQIFGPRESWPHIHAASYGGILPFDGKSVQDVYKRNGVGLCFLSRDHLADDVISNRLFEITSVGAVAICCDTPWIRKWFGESVYYVDQTLPDRSLIEEISARIDEIYSDPVAALTKAAQAKQIFEQTFSAERLLDNAVHYHLDMQERRTSAVCRLEQPAPLISVVIRCGSRPIELVRRAVTSIARQTYGRFEIVFVRWSPIDLSEFCYDFSPNFASVVVYDCMGGTCSETLWCGLRKVSGEFFAVLDDDDWFFSNHFETLFTACHNTPWRKLLVHSAAVLHHDEPKELFGGGVDNRELYGYSVSLGPTLTTEGFTTNCFMASRDLLHPALLEDPAMKTGEDSYLILSLLAQAVPRFSFLATCVKDQSGEGHAFVAGRAERFEDLLTLQVRLSGQYRPAFASDDAWQALSVLWRERASFGMNPEFIETSERIIIPSVQYGPSLHPQALEITSTGFDPEHSDFKAASRPIEPKVGSALVRPPTGVPWAFGATLHWNTSPDLGGREYLLVVELVVESGEAGLGLLNRAETDFIYRRPLRAGPKIWEVHIPVSSGAEVGRLVVQNWERTEPVSAKVLNLKLYA
jgi:hypothetical protein